MENEYKFDCCCHDSSRTLNWCEDNCPRYYYCNTVAEALDWEREYTEMCSEIVSRIVNMCVGDEFCFSLCERDNEDIRYDIGVKCIQEFSSTLIIVGNHGGGFNMIFLANENMLDRDRQMTDEISNMFAECFEGCNFVGLNHPRDDIR